MQYVCYTRTVYTGLELDPTVCVFEFCHYSFVLALAFVVTFRVVFVPTFRGCVRHYLLFFPEGIHMWGFPVYPCDYLSRGSLYREFLPAPVTTPLQGTPTEGIRPGRAPTGVRAAF